MKICLACEGVTDTQAQRCGNCRALLLPTDAVHYPARRGELDAGNPLLGTVIDGKYRLQSVLGRGGLGTVYRAQHVGSLVTVALKLLHPRFAEHPEYRRALLPEARRAATVVHERCARLLDVGEGDEGITFLAMELVEGQTLEEVLQDGPLARAHAVDILLQVSAALSAVHDVGLVHCDLSPRNVMVTARTGRLEAKVLDFGIARSVNIAGRRSAQGELSGFANPAFAAPELLAGEDVDPRADVYSFGTLAWLLLTGTMPVDDSDRDRAVAAVREGRLLAWPGGAGIPKRLVRLILRCLEFDRERRPTSIDEVHQRLQALRSGRGPALVLARLAAFAAALALVVTLAAGDAARPMFLRPQPGSALQVSEGPLLRDPVVQDLRADELATIEFHFGGIAPERLVAEVARDGKVLARVPLEPTVDRKAGTLVLSDGQRAWLEVLTGLSRTSRDGPVDLAFVVPGAAVLGAGRLRVDDVPPEVEARFENLGAVLRRDTRLFVDLRDHIGIAQAEIEVRLADGEAHVLPLPPRSGTVAIGEELAARVTRVAPLGAGELVVRAEDHAGNRRELLPIAFAAADVAAPQVLEITGPAGQRGLTRSGDRLRFRVQLTAGEAGCRLRCRHGDAELLLPMSLAAGEQPVGQAFDVDAGALFAAAGELELLVAVLDPAGNVSERAFPVRVVDRSPELVLLPEAGDEAPPVALVGRELVLGPAGGAFGVRVAGRYDVAGARLERDGRLLVGEGVACTTTAPGAARLVLQPLDPGPYTMWIELDERDGEQLEPVRRELPVRVLPGRIEVRVPASAARFLPQLVDDGVLAVRAGAAAGRVGEGHGWRYDPELRRYVQGICYAEDRPSATVRAAEGALLPDLLLAPGRNALSLALVDALGRPVSIVDENGGPRVGASGRALIASFWWSDERPRLVGERLLVEHDRPLRVRVRMPLPFDERDRDRLRLGFGNGEWPAVVVAPDGGGSVVAFDVPFAVWSVAAQLAGRSRRDFAGGLEARVVAYVHGPGGRDELDLSLRTTRSTLAPLRLGDVTDVPSGLEDLRLLPVLAPDGPFEEPMPAQAPPRFTFRPQPATPVRNMPDIMLQDRELDLREARALCAFALGLDDAELRARCVHHNDPFGDDRLLAANLLPDGLDDVPDAHSLHGVDFFQAWTLSRLLGVAVANDPELFRLPLGCELERAAFSERAGTACHGAGAHGNAVRMRAFDSFAPTGGTWGAEVGRELGDVVPTSYGIDFVGLDFGLREWVLDLPHMAGAELLLREW
ncbi:MAG: serine/threonine protein kinase, partial [Planctomycetes bacterium]|nr:serine/threonine protein kinase [Planctomycetota bacterium]